MDDEEASRALHQWLRSSGPHQRNLTGKGLAVEIWKAAWQAGYDEANGKQNDDE